MRPPDPKLGEKVGQYFVEGISVLSQMLLRDHTRNCRKLSEDVIGSFKNTTEVEGPDGKVTPEVMTFGDAGRSHYKNVQLYMLHDLIPRFGAGDLKGVSRVIWTGHEGRGDDDVSGMKGTILGPITIGPKGVVHTAQAFGDTLHYVRVAKAGGAPSSPSSWEFRAYYESHPDDLLPRMTWPAKLSLPLGRVGELRKRFPGGFVPLGTDPGKGMDAYLEFKYGGAKASPRS